MKSRLFNQRSKNPAVELKSVRRLDLEPVVMQDEFNPKCKESKNSMVKLKELRTNRLQLIALRDELNAKFKEGKVKPSHFLEHKEPKPPNHSILNKLEIARSKLKVPSLPTETQSKPELSIALVDVAIKPKEMIKTRSKWSLKRRASFFTFTSEARGNFDFIQKRGSESTQAKESFTSMPAF